jgi:signal transduction histidine kinase
MARLGLTPPHPHRPAAGSPARRLARLAVRAGGACVIVGLLAMCAQPATAAGKPRTILVLYSNSRLLPANQEFDRGFRATLLNTPDRQVVLFEEFLGSPRFAGRAYEQTMSRYLLGKYGSGPPAVIVTVSEAALDFVLRNRAGLFPRVPVVHLAVPRPFLRPLAPLPADVVGVPVDYDVAGTIGLALRLHPRARRLVLVTGASAADRVWEARVREETRCFAPRAAREFLAGQPTEVVLKRLRELGHDAVVFTPGYFQDGAGRDFAPREAAAAMAAASAAPVYGPYDTFVGAGVVGGRMPDFEDMGRQAGELAGRLLDGVEPAALRPPKAVPTNWVLDGRQVHRWGIDARAIPGDAVVRFRTPAFWEVYRREALAGAAALMVQAGLIIWLVLERRRRRRAEQSSQEHRLDLARAARFAVAGTLTGAIAHEINQPLGAILSNTDAAELILESGADRCDQLRGILPDIRRDALRASEVIRRLRGLLAMQEVERRPFDLSETAREVEAMLRAEAQRRRVSLYIGPVATSATMVGDRIQIQQVLLNLVLNAMDEVAGLPDGRRRVVVSVERLARGVVIAVRDFGRGIAPEHMAKIFDSFFTTKQGGMGLGLSVAKMLVEAQGGRIWAENGLTEGAVFRVELPASGAKGFRAPGHS